MKKRTKIIIAVAVALLVAVTAWIIWGNLSLSIGKYTVKGDRLPSAFSGFRIAQVSDLHGAEFGKDNARLIAALRETGPDIIVITGDFIDDGAKSLDVALKFIREAVLIAPIYYVSGNHEADVCEDYDRLKSEITSLGVVVLENDSVKVERDGESIAVIGLSDPSFSALVEEDECKSEIAAQLSRLKDENNFCVVLSHRPQYFDTYVESDVDLVLSGHFHGGQVRLPFLGGLYVPSQGLFPEYDAGLFSENDTVMIVSRGIGNGHPVPRVNNRPEIVIIELLSANPK